MYSGPGPGPLLAASEAWDGLAAELGFAASGYGSALAELTSNTWVGPTSVAMIAAVTPYITWLTSTGAQAEETANHARAAVAAYEAAFAMTVPPPVIAANRALLMALVATNFFGQNTPAIMATEAQYVEMWIQDAVAMFGYSGASSTASALTPIPTPVQNTNPSGLGALAAAATQVASTTAGTASQMLSSLGSAMSSALETLASTVTSSMPSTTPLSSLATSTLASSAAATSGTTLVSSSSAAISTGTTLASGTASSASMVTSAMSALGSSGSLAQSVSPAAGVLGGGFPMLKSSFDVGVSPAAGAWSSPAFGDFEVAATSGRAASLGALSVPQGWTSAAPAFSQVASASPAGGAAAGASPPVVPSGQGAPFGPATPRSAGRQSDSAPQTASFRYRPAVVQRPLYTG